MDSFFEYECRKCGLVDEACFVFAGPHVKQICNGCGKYVKFFDMTKIPDVIDIKLKIYALAKQDLNTIYNAKNEIGFIDGLTGLYGKINYWKLYLHLRNICR